MSYISTVRLRDMKNEMIYLESVGSYLDPKEGIIYPAFETDEPDMDNPISLVEDEVASDWWEGLSAKDYFICKEFY